MSYKKKENYLNLVGSLDEFKDEDKNIGKVVLFSIGGITLALLAVYLFKNLSK